MAGTMQKLHKFMKNVKTRIVESVASLYYPAVHLAIFLYFFATIGMYRAPPHLQLTLQS
jgi:hypothetical protein